MVILYLGSQSSTLNFYAPVDVSDWAIGTSIKVTNNAHTVDASTFSQYIVNDAVITSINAVPIPGALWLVFTGLGLAGLRKRLKK
jgi:hypothetical protein